MHTSILPSHRAASSRVSQIIVYVVCVVLTFLLLHLFRPRKRRRRRGKHHHHHHHQTKEGIKLELIKLGAKTDRGQLLFPQKAYAPLDEYNRKHREEVKVLVELLTSYSVSTGNSNKIEKEQLNGEECVLATKQIFRSSPFFMAIQDSFGDATFGDAKSSEVFFRLHDLQVMSWGRRRSEESRNASTSKRRR